MNWIEPLIDEYFKFLKEKTLVHEIPTNEWVEISTPFTDMYNDTIDLYARKDNAKILLSDDGKTLKNLELSGVEISRSKQRKEMFERILLTYGVREENSELVVDATETTFPQKKLNLMTAIAEANDLYVMAKHTIASVFREDVREFLDEQELIFTPFFISKGSTGLEFTFDFQIAYRKTELLIKAFNSINKLYLPHFLFAWDDVRQVRERQTQKKVTGLAVINDEDKEVKPEYLDALQSKGAIYILWSQRHTPENLGLLKEAA